MKSTKFCVDCRFLRAVSPGLAIGLVSALFIAIRLIAGWVMGLPPPPSALVPTFSCIAAAVAIIGVAAEYSPFSGGLWRFSLGAGGVLMCFLLVMLWQGIATGDWHDTTQETRLWILGISVFAGFFGAFCGSRVDESAQQDAARDGTKKGGA